MKTDALKIKSICSQEWKHENLNEPHILPIYNSSAFVFNDIQDGIKIFKGEKEGYVYSRYNNPTLATTAGKLAAIESIDSPDEAYCLLTGSGMGAISTLLYAVLEQGDTILTQADLYGGTTELMQSVLNKFGVKCLVTDLRDDEGLRQLLSNEKVKLIYTETPSNPLLACVDIEKISGIAKEFGCLTAIDNTFATPLLQRPFSFGIDYIIYSTTKYLNGMGNALGGAILTRDNEAYKNLWHVGKLNGTYCSPTDAWYLYNGLKTFPIRMEEHCKNAMTLAEYLEANDRIAKVNYPGLPSHRDHEIAKKQMKAFGGMLSFEVAGGLDEAIQFMNALKLSTLAPTLGNVDTILLHPATSSHLKVPKEVRERIGIGDGLVRVSVGIEDITDVIADFQQALETLA